MQFQLTKEFIEQLKERVAANDSPWILSHVLELHHADIADILDELSHEEAKYVYHLSSEELQGDILMDLQEGNRDRLIESLNVQSSFSQTPVKAAGKNAMTTGLPVISESLVRLP